jgi:hypothetical protein
LPSTAVSPAGRKLLFKSRRAFTGKANFAPES